MCCEDGMVFMAILDISLVNLGLKST
jgi:hypothetical protein